MSAVGIDNVLVGDRGRSLYQILAYWIANTHVHVRLEVS